MLLLMYMGWKITPLSNVWYMVIYILKASNVSRGTFLGIFGYHFIMGLMGLKALFILCITKSLSQWVLLKGLMNFWQVDVSRVLETAVFLKNSILNCRNRKIK